LAVKGFIFDCFSGTLCPQEAKNGPGACGGCFFNFRTTLHFELKTLVVAGCKLSARGEAQVQRQANMQQAEKERKMCKTKW
jgi:hypothetical protein